MIVFVSYQRADTLYAAHAVAFALQLAGHKPFVDTGSIGGAAQYRQTISNAISKAHVMLALVGPAFDWARLWEPTSVVAFEWRRARFSGSGVVPVLVDQGKIPPDRSLPAALRWFTRRDAYPLRAASLSADVKALVDAVPLLAGTPRRPARILWVDDEPANNEKERQRLRPHGIVFDNVVSTKEAVGQLEHESYDLVITDLGRQHSSDASSRAGAAFLEHPVIKEGGPPVIVYAGRNAVALRSQLVRRGAVDATNDPDRLFDAVLLTLGRVPQPAGSLER